MEHEYDILDLEWRNTTTSSTVNKNNNNINKDNSNNISNKKDNLLLLTCSFDQRVILWDLNLDKHIQIYEHPNVTVKVCFNPELDNLFVSGCLDRTVRLWKIDQKIDQKSKPIDQ